VSFGIPLHVGWLTPNHLLESCSGSLVFAIFLCPSFSCARYHLLRGSSTSGADDDPELLRRLQASGLFCFDYLSSGGRSSTTTSTSIVHLYKNLVEQKVDPLRTQGRWPRACYALGPAGSSSRYVSVRLVRFPLRMDLWFSDCCLFFGTHLDPFGQVLCVFEPLYLLSASFA